MAPERTELALAIAVVFLAIPVHRFIRPRAERFFFPERPAFEDGIHELLDELSDIEGRDRLIERVGSRLMTFLEVRTCVVFVLGETGYEAV